MRGNFACRFTNPPDKFVAKDLNIVEQVRQRRVKQERHERLGVLLQLVKQFRQHRNDPTNQRVTKSRHRFDQHADPVTCDPVDHSHVELDQLVNQ